MHNAFCFVHLHLFDNKIMVGLRRQVFPLKFGKKKLDILAVRGGLCKSVTFSVGVFAALAAVVLLQLSIIYYNTNVGT